MKITAELLGQILFEEFDRDSWGTIEPWYFNKKTELGDEMHGLSDVLQRVVERLVVLS